jgi:hypothetical protein
MKGSAVFSEGDDYRYRYRLERILPTEGRTAAVLMVNPSKAGADLNDPTVGKLLGFAERLSISRIIVGNEFALCSTDIKGLRTAKDPIGPDNDKHLEQIMRDADVHIVAWGARAKLPEVLRKRWIEVVRIADRVGCKLHCIGTNADGHPKHPLMTGYDVPMTEWTVPWFPNRRAA